MKSCFVKGPNGWLSVFVVGPYLFLSCVHNQAINNKAQLQSSDYG